MTTGAPQGSWRRSTLIVYTAQFVAQAVAIVSLMLLARLVPKAEFGLMGILFPLVLLPRMMATLGFGAATIQQQTEDNASLSGLFWRNLHHSLWAAVATVVLGAAAAALCQTSELLPLSAVLSLATILNAFSVIPLALLERRMHFVSSTSLRVVAQLLAAVSAIVLALQGAEVWALIAQHLVEFVVLLLAWPLSRWSPLPRGESHVPHAAGQLSSAYSLSMVLQFVAQYADKLLLAVWLGNSEDARAIVGMYSQAYNLMMRPVYIVSQPLSAVMLSALSRLQSDEQSQRAALLRYFRFAALLLFPAAAGLFAVADEVILLLAPTWSEAAAMLRAFSPAIVANGLANTAAFALTARGKSRGLLTLSGLQVVILLIAMAAGLSWSDQGTAEFLPYSARAATTLAWSISLLTLVMVLPTLLYLVARAFELSVIKLASTLAWPLISSLAMGAVVWILRGWLVEQNATPLIRLPTLVATGAFFYLVFALPRVKSLLADA